MLTRLDLNSIKDENKENIEKSLYDNKDNLPYESNDKSDNRNFIKNDNLPYKNKDNISIYGKSGRSLTPVLLRSSARYSITSQGSRVTIVDGKIHGLPILKGVCQNCLNKELISLKNLPSKSSIWSYNEDPFKIQEKRNENMLNNIKLKVKKIDKLSKLALPLYSQNDKDVKKDKLINDFLKDENPIYKQRIDIIRERVLKNYNELNKLNNISYNLRLRRNRTLTPNRGNNILTEYSIPMIGEKKYRNKYVISKEDYEKILKNQIADKEKRKQNERKIDIENERKIYIKNLEDIKKENESRKNYMDKLKSDFLRQNSNIIRMKYTKNKINLDKEKEEFNKNINNDKNVYLEEAKNIRYGRCKKCQKLTKANHLCDEREYEQVYDMKIKKKEELY